MKEKKDLFFEIEGEYITLTFTNYEMLALVGAIEVILSLINNKELIVNRLTGMLLCNIKGKLDSVCIETKKETIQ